MGLEASLPTNLWPETITAAGYIANRTPIRKLGWKTPFEIIHGVKPSYTHLHVFGCRAYALNKHIPHSQKLNSRVHLGHLVGYASTNIFKVWIPSKNKVIRTRDATFEESKFYDPKDLDIGAVLRESAEEIVLAIDVSEWKNWESETMREENDIIIDVPSNPQDVKTLIKMPIIKLDKQKYQNKDDLILSSNQQADPQISNIKQTQKEISDFKIPKHDEINSSKNINSNIDVNNIITGK